MEWERRDVAGSLRKMPPKRTGRAEVSRGRAGDEAPGRRPKKDIEWDVGICAEQNKRISSQLDFSPPSISSPPWVVARSKFSQLLCVFSPPPRRPALIPAPARAQPRRHLFKGTPSNLFAIFAHSIFILGPPPSSARMASSKRPTSSVFFVLSTLQSLSLV
jgi:hypothetical protein